VDFVHGSWRIPIRQTIDEDLKGLIPISTQRRQIITSCTPQRNIGKAFIKHGTTSGISEIRTEHSERGRHRPILDNENAGGLAARSIPQIAVNTNLLVVRAKPACM